MGDLQELPQLHTGLYGPTHYRPGVHSNQVHTPYHVGTDEDHLDMPPMHPYLEGNGGGSPGSMAGPTTSYTDAMDVNLITSIPVDGESSSGHTPLSSAERGSLHIRNCNQRKSTTEDARLLTLGQESRSQVMGHLGCELQVAELSQPKISLKLICY